jgi:hypothetical protein
LAVLLRRSGLAPEVLRKAPALLVARDLEAVAGIFVLAARTPVAGPSIPGWLNLRAAFRNRVSAFLVLRVPEAAACEPFHHRVRMTHLQLPQRRHQLFLRMRSECGGLSFEDDRPVMVPGGHGSDDYGSFVGLA